MFLSGVRDPYTFEEDRPSLDLDRKKDFKSGIRKNLMISLLAKCVYIGKLSCSSSGVSIHLLAACDCVLHYQYSPSPKISIFDMLV